MRVKLNVQLVYGTGKNRKVHGPGPVDLPEKQARRYLANGLASIGPVTKADDQADDK